MTLNLIGLSGYFGIAGKHPGWSACLNFIAFYWFPKLQGYFCIETLQTYTWICFHTRFHHTWLTTFLHTQCEGKKLQWAWRQGKKKTSGSRQGKKKSSALRGRDFSAEGLRKKLQVQSEQRKKYSFRAGSFLRYQTMNHELFPLLPFQALASCLSSAKKMGDLQMFD